MEDILPETGRRVGRLLRALNQTGIFIRAETASATIRETDPFDGARVELPARSLTLHVSRYATAAAA
jgi:hypothetical protein